MAFASLFIIIYSQKNLIRFSPLALMPSFASFPNDYLTLQIIIIIIIEWSSSKK